MKSICDQVDEYLEGLFDAEAEAGFESHLESCAACQFEVEIERKIDQEIFMEWEGVTAPDHIREFLQSSLELKGAESNRDGLGQSRSRVLAICLAVAAMILVLVSFAVWHLNDNVNREITEAQNPAVISSVPQTFAATQLKEPLGLAPVATAIPSLDSNSIFVPQTQSSKFTILRAYPALTYTSQGN